MSEEREILDWKAPAWHPDYGDPQREVDMLHDVATALTAMQSDCAVKLIEVEEGYMNLDIYKDNRKVGEIHVVEGEKKNSAQRYGVFLFGKNGEQEIYSPNASEVAKIVHAFTDSVAAISTQ